MSRVTRKELENMVQRINELRGTEELDLYYLSAYQGYRVGPKYELYSAHKVSELARRCNNRQRMSAREMKVFLSGILEILGAQAYEMDLKKELKSLLK